MKANLIQVTSLKNFKLLSLNGDIGKVKEVYFDDRHWMIRYLVADTGNWLFENKVFISPRALKSVHRDTHELGVDLTKKQIEESPSIDSDKPVSRQYETDYHRYYDWPEYWVGDYSWGYSPHTVKGNAVPEDLVSDLPKADSHLRSSQDLFGHSIETSDGPIGQVEDLIVDLDTWTIRYLVIDTRKIWLGKKILLAPQWTDGISWGESKVFVTLSRETIREAPFYHGETSLTRDYEEKLYKYYKISNYWEDQLKVLTPSPAYST